MTVIAQDIERELKLNNFTGIYVILYYGYFVSFSQYIQLDIVSCERRENKERFIFKNTFSITQDSYVYIS